MISWALRLYALILLLLGMGLGLGGAQLVVLGGSPYYLLTGLGFAVAAAMLFARRRAGADIYLAILVATIAWSVWEAGFDGWRLMPRLVGPVVVALPLFIPAFTNALKGKKLFSLPVAGIAVVLAVIVGAGTHAFTPQPVDPVYQAGTTEPAKEATVNADSDPDTGNWPVWGRDDGGSRFSPLTQITPTNVDELKVAWTYRTGPDASGAFQRLSVTPLKVDDTVYICTAWNDIVALDAETGVERWRAPSGAQTDPFGSCRGVAYYKVPNMDGQCAARIITNTVDSRLIAVDASTGQRCADFGKGGEVSLLKGMGEVKRSYYLVDSAPVIVRGRIVLGGRVIDNQYWGEPSGVIRAFDAVTGKFSWAFDVGNLGRQTEPPEGETYTHSTPNSWAPMSADNKLGLVYAPTGNATPDYFGGRRRPFDEKFSSSVVAIDAETGKLRWSFQTLRHDLWDFDVPAQPTLVDIPGPDNTVRHALVQATKRGELFVLDRVTGKPIFEVTERRSPTAGQAPDERASPTQPYSTGMPSLAGPILTERDMWGITPLDQLWCRIEFRKARYDGPLTPPGLTRSIQYPGPAGGSNWGGVAIDTDRNILIANATRMASRVQLLTRAEADRRGLEAYDAEGGKGFAGAGPQLKTPYAVDMTFFFSPLQVPCPGPPFGTISGIDLTTGKLIWTKPFGTAENSGPFGWRSYLPISVGVPSVGGAMTTRSGLTFIAATQEDHFRAFDTRTGKLLWDTKLPVSGHAIPMTYTSPKSGRQFVVIAASGFAALKSGSGDYIVAYALPKR